MADDKKPTSDAEDKITLESKNDWLTLAEDKAFKEDKALLVHESLDSLLTDYVKLKNKEEVKPLTKESSDEDFLKASETLFNISEDSYSKDFEHKDAALKYKLPNRLVEPFLKEIKELQTKKEKEEHAKLMIERKEEIHKEVPKEVFETRFSAGLQQLNMTPEEFKNVLPEKERTKPKLVVAIAKLGEKSYSKKEKDVETGSDTLPNDVGLLKNMITSLASERLQLKLKGESTFNINDRITSVKAKFNKMLLKHRKKELEDSFLF